MVAAMGLWGMAWAAPPGGWPTPPTEARVAKVYDGDTLTLVTGDKVRLKWVNTPELKPAEPYGPEAGAFAERFVLDEVVTLILEGDNPRDSYGRVLAGIRGPQGDLSEALLRNGFAHLFIIPPDAVDTTAMLAAEAEARRQRLGIWSTPAFQGDFHITSFHANASGDDTTNVNGEYLRVANISGAPANTDGWRLVDDSGATHRLPALTIPAGHTVMIHSGAGPLQADPGHQLKIHLGSPSPLWNNTEETVTLYDPRGLPIDSRSHHGSP